MVVRDNPVARATKDTPPRPNSPASAAAQKRRPRSSSIFPVPVQPPCHTILEITEG
jgi:hypothetical protein